MANAAKIPGKKRTHGALWQRKVTFTLFAVPGFILYCFFFIAPIIMGFYYSMTDWNGISRSYGFIGFQNYQSIVKNQRFLKALVFNLKYTLLLTIFIVVLGIVLALLLNQNIKGRAFFRSMYFLPAVLSALTVGLVFYQIFYRAIPPIGKALGIETFSSNILANPDLAMYGVLFVNIWQGVALPTLLFLAGLQTIPTDLYEAASLDGANALQKFRSITMPYLVPVLSVVLVLTLKSGLMVFDYIKSLTEGGPGGKTESLAMLIYKHGFEENMYSYSIAEAMLAGLIICLISALQITLSNRKKVA